jgi:hypothetical protein
VVETNDYLLKTPWPTYEGEFYDMGDFISQVNPTTNVYRDRFFQLRVGSHDSFYIHNREVYDLLDLLGDTGGVLEVVLSVIAIMVAPIAHFSFVMKAMQ